MHRSPTCTVKVGKGLPPRPIEPFRRGESMSLSGLLNTSLHIIDVHDMQDKSADKYVRTDVSRLDDLCQGSGWLHHVKSM